MMDRRLTAYNGRVAAIELKGQVEADKFVRGEVSRISTPVAD